MSKSKTNITDWTSKIYDVVNRLFEEEDEEEVFLDFSELLIIKKLVLAKLDMEKVLWILIKFLDLAYIIHLLLKS